MTRPSATPVMTSALVLAITLSACAAGGAAPTAVPPSPTVEPSPTIQPTSPPEPSVEPTQPAEPSVPAEPSPASPGPSEPTGLPGMAWQLVELDGEDTTPFDITLEFGADGTAGGTGGCNSYGGNFETDGETISIRDVFSTEMSCGQRDRAEQLFFQTLGEVDGWRMADGRLELTEAGETRLVFEAKADEEVPADLDGTSWRLATLDGEDIPADAGITASFRSGQVEGSGGCNTYGGQYQVDGEAIRFSPLNMTMMLCAAPAGTWEVAFVDALGASSTFRVEDGRLILSAAEGADRLIFERTD